MPSRWSILLNKRISNQGDQNIQNHFLVEKSPNWDNSITVKSDPLRTESPVTDGAPTVMDVQLKRNTKEP